MILAWSGIAMVDTGVILFAYNSLFVSLVVEKDLPRIKHNWYSSWYLSKVLDKDLWRTKQIWYGLEPIFELSQKTLEV